MADYQRALEEHDFMKREGLSAYADLICDMLCELFGKKIDPDKMILIKEGVRRLMVGPPSMPMMLGPFQPPNIDAAFEPPPSQFYEEEIGPGCVTVWDWATVAVEATRADRLTTNAPRRRTTVLLWRFDELLLTLEGPAAESFWEWSTFMRKASEGGPVRVHRRRQHSARRRRSATAPDSTGGL
jgi:hypothetical protein